MGLINMTTIYRESFKEDANDVDKLCSYLLWEINKRSLDMTVGDKLEIITRIWNEFYRYEQDYYNADNSIRPDIINPKGFTI